MSSIITTSSAVEQERWKDKVTPEQYEAVPERERQRQEVIYELIRTEREYVRDLGIVIDVFLKPIKEKKILSPKEMALFSSIDQLKPVNEELLRRLTERFDVNPVVEEVGDVFVTLAEYFKIYKVYCRNHPHSMLEYQRLKTDGKNKKFKQFEEEALKKTECRLMDLQSFLLKPVQRICKYPLLIREILKFTDETHKDHEGLEKAFNIIQVIVQIVNEATKEEAHFRRILEIQKSIEKIDLLLPGRKLLFEDTVTVMPEDHKKKDDHPRGLYLFNDLFLVTRQKDKEKPAEVVKKLPFAEVAYQNTSSEDHHQVTVTEKTRSGKIAINFKDEEALKKFVEAWEQAQNWEASDSFRPEAGAEAQEIREIDEPPELDLPDQLGLVESVYVFEIVILPNTQSHGSYKSSRHIVSGRSSPACFLRSVGCLIFFFFFASFLVSRCKGREPRNTRSTRPLTRL